MLLRLVCLLLLLDGYLRSIWENKFRRNLLLFKSIRKNSRLWLKGNIKIHLIRSWQEIVNLCLFWRDWWRNSTILSRSMRKWRLWGSVCVRLWILSWKVRQSRSERCCLVDQGVHLRCWNWNDNVFLSDIILSVVVVYGYKGVAVKFVFVI
jgi:hypothetical protein